MEGCNGGTLMQGRMRDCGLLRAVPIMKGSAPLISCSSPVPSDTCLVGELADSCDKFHRPLVRGSGSPLQQGFLPLTQQRRLYAV